MHRDSQQRNLTPAIRASLQAKLERLLTRPIIANIPRSNSAASEAAPAGRFDIFRAIQMSTRDSQPTAGRMAQGGAWSEDSDDGTCRVRIDLDYDDLWRGCEKEILETVRSTVESPVTFLTNEQKVLLERSPREFLALNPRPESAELVSYEVEDIGGSNRVVSLTVAAPPATPRHVHFIAIVPNLVQIERQLDALDAIERALDDGPLAPLRALVGLCGADRLHSPVAQHSAETLGPPIGGERLDQFQAECIAKAMSTPHFAVIKGPPGSGKTTVIASVIRRAVERGGRVLVVSPTHVAIDNVVDKLAPQNDRLADDRLAPHTVPVRYAARKNKLSKRAMEYWVGSKGQVRGATIARRVQLRLTEAVGAAKALYAREDANASGTAPLSSAIASIEAVICGTPIGVLSYAMVKDADPGTFDLLIVDEVSKMTLPEFLAIAVKAKRWVLVGDPEQLPPFNSSEDNAPVLDDVLLPLLELVCSVAAILERTKHCDRRTERLVVVTDNPGAVASAIRRHIDAVLLDSMPRISEMHDDTTDGVLVCTLEDVDEACSRLAPTRGRDHTRTPDHRGSLRILVERGVSLRRPQFADGTRFIEPKERAQARIFDAAFNVYHAQPWSKRSNHELLSVRNRKGLEKYLPSSAAFNSLNGTTGTKDAAACRDQIAVRYAINTVSVYDWLIGIPSDVFDVSPLKELAGLPPVAVCDAVHPFVGVLKKQYRMHASISRIPRELFYFDEALYDDKAVSSSGCYVEFVQVSEGGEASSEKNRNECERICRMLKDLNTNEAVKELKSGIMVITPYRAQQKLLADTIDDLRQQGHLDRLDVEALTLDSCQGREAECVFISLVRSRVTPFLDMPKRWNVALTRAKLGLFIVGDVDAYLWEASIARSPRGSKPMSLLARIVEAYDRQLADHRNAGGNA